MNSNKNKYKILVFDETGKFMNKQIDPISSGSLDSLNTEVSYYSITTKENKIFYTSVMAFDSENKLWIHSFTKDIPRPIRAALLILGKTE